MLKGDTVWTLSKQVGAPTRVSYPLDTDGILCDCDNYMYPYFQRTGATALTFKIRKAGQAGQH